MTADAYRQGRAKSVDLGAPVVEDRLQRAFVDINRGLRLRLAFRILATPLEMRNPNPRR